MGNDVLIHKNGTYLPPGSIIVWYGEPNKIPLGWHLCDGTNGTPDLRNRFIVGAGDTYSVGDTGGQDTVELTTDELPAHTHNTTLTPTTEGVYGSTGSSAALSMGSNNFLRDSHKVLLDGNFYTVNVENTGSNQAHENRPPYYALCYIMKLR